MRWLILMMATVLAGSPVAACGPDSDCTVGVRTYRIAMPPDRAAPVGALVYMHGYRGSASGAMRNKALVAFAHTNGMALVAANAAGEDWMIPGVPGDPQSDGAAELAYFDALIETLRAKHGIDTDRLLATGFSAGGMMVWTLACHRGASFAGFAPISGTFWDPVPNSCPGGPVNLVHVHGRSDAIVPLAGRAIGPSRQGNVYEALEMATRAGQFTPIDLVSAEDLSCSPLESAKGTVLAFCTHPGGHSFRVDYLATALNLIAPRAGLPPFDR